MRFFGKLIKTLLRSAFSIIIFLLLVGLAKMKRDMNSYISFLNESDWSVFHRSQLGTRVDPFRPQQQSTTLDDMLSDDALDAELSDMDAYDPSLEDELNQLVDDSLSGSEDDFGFTTDAQDTGTHDSADTSVSKSELLDLIKERELAQ